MFAFVSLLLAQAPPADAQAPGNQDFRVYVFAAYGAAIALLLLFSLWSSFQVGAAERKLERLLGRLEEPPQGKR